MIAIKCTEQRNYVCGDHVSLVDKVWVKPQISLAVTISVAYIDYTFVHTYYFKEYHYWLEKHSVYVTFNGTTHSAFRYKADTDSPRPESYREDEADGLSIPQGECLILASYDCYLTA